MTQLPATIDHGAAVARLAVPTFLAAVSATLFSLALVIVLEVSGSALAARRLPGDGDHHRAAAVAAATGLERSICRP